MTSPKPSLRPPAKNRFEDYIWGTLSYIAQSKGEFFRNILLIQI